MLDKQRQTYQDLANNVLNEEFYKTSDIHFEKKKFNTFTNEMKNKEIFALRNKIKDKNGEKNNRNETEDSMVQRARQRMMRKNHSQAKAKQIKKIVHPQQKFSSSKFNTANNNSFRANLSTSKIKENSISPNASMDNPLDSNTSVPHPTHPNKDCKIFISFLIKNL